jgi:hypothetical protein
LATTAPDTPVESRETITGDLAGIPAFLIDPEAAAARLDTKWFWVGAIIVISILAIAARIVLMPVTQHVLELQPAPPNVTSEQFQRQIAIGMTIQHFANYAMPVIVACLIAVQALILWGSASVLGIQAKFRSLFNLAAGCGLISALAAIAMAIIVQAKGASTLAELRPPLGFDILLGDGANKFLAAFAGYFSVFEIWWIVMAVLVFGAGFRVTKGKAAAAIAPLVVLGLAMHLLSAVFRH